MRVTVDAPANGSLEKDTLGQGAERCSDERTLAGALPARAGQLLL